MTYREKNAVFNKFPFLLEIKEELLIYEELLCHWQKTINLVSKSTLTSLWERHFADSAQLFSYAPSSISWVDMGSGAGFPGIVIALFQKKHLSGSMTLVDSDKKKIAFLREVSRETSISVDIQNRPCDLVLREAQYDVLTSRAMADLSSLFALTQHQLDKGGLGLFLKGKSVHKEIEQAHIPDSYTVEALPSRVSNDGSIIKIHHKYLRH